ncbi:MAG: SDR family oxidoreductase [Lunatimonas sp.]|uniref:SDR family NAD(P)-dependent oxidoreductase n=1 Tax=Lunatimonas sp. TaxID=2060141 RepID=UPI00263BAA96|nr:SDR family oxidoreductase [Lunatimonas sp.]MCC5936613.1 SDR family oxidoreductase [Lunatimonas sp.]
MRLKDKVIIVTGSTTGIGKAIAVRSVAEGAKVVVHGLEADWADQVVEELGKDRSVSLVGDLAQESTATRLVELAIERFGKLDAVVNNAAIVAASNLESTDTDFMEKILRVNTIAPFLLIKAALPYLEKSSGCVLNIGSVNAWSGEPNLLAYSISKGGLMTMTRNLGDVLFREHGVKINQINPGWVLTETEIERKKEHGLSDTWYENLPAMYAPARRIILPKEIAAAAVFWLSDESGPVSGQVMELEQYPMIGRNAPKDTSTIQ